MKPGNTADRFLVSSSWCGHRHSHVTASLSHKRPEKSHHIFATEGPEAAAAPGQYTAEQNCHIVGYTLARPASRPEYRPSSGRLPRDSKPLVHGRAAAVRPCEIDQSPDPAFASEDKQYP